MKSLLRAVSLALMAMGAVWFLQGVNVLPGSFMTGQTKWAIYGSLLLVVGVGMVVRANRRFD